MDTDPLDLALAEKIFHEEIFPSKQAKWHESEARTVETDDFRADSKNKFSPYLLLQTPKKNVIAESQDCHGGVRMQQNVVPLW